MSGISANNISGPDKYSSPRGRSILIAVWVSYIIVFTISILDIAGWIFNVNLLKSIGPQWVPMKVITSLCFIFSVSALILIHSYSSAFLSISVSRTLALFVFVVSLTTIAGYFYFIITGSEVSITLRPVLQLFLRVENRMELLPALIFLLISFILFLLSIKNKRAADITHILLFPVAASSYFIPVSYFLGTTSNNDLLNGNVALNTGISFCAISTAILFLRTDTWLMKVFTSDHVGGIMSRKLLPPLLILPPVIGWVHIEAERAGLFESAFGVGLVAMTYSLCFVWLIWRTARSINQVEQRVIERTSELKLANEKLYKSRQEWIETFDLIPDLIAIIDTKHRILRANKAMRDKSGVSAIEATGTPCYECVHGTTSAPSYCPHTLTLIDGKQHIAEIHEDRLGGDFIVSNTPMFDNMGNLIGSVHVARDITDRKKDEEKLFRLNRSLTSLFKSSQVMMHAISESQYLNQVCRIIFEECGHELVWIGFAQDDMDKSVLPVAYSGFDNEYIKQMNITWADTVRGRGPTGRAIRTGKPAICINMLTDPAFEPWRDEALKRGYASSIVLPLNSIGKTFGAISIYSKETNPFSEEEIDLLSKLAADLAYGIKYIRLLESEKSALKTLKESEEKYRLLFDGMTEGFAYHELITDEAGNPCDYRFISINQAFEKQTGLKAENTIGKKFSEVLPDGEKNWIDLYGKVALTGEPLEFESFSSGLNRYFKVSSFSPKKGFFAIIFENITNRILAEKELEKTKNYLESLINYANAPIIVWNTKKEIELFNRASEQLTGYSSAQVEGKKLSILFPKDALEESNAKIRHSLKENLETMEIPILTKSNEIRIVLWNSANIYDDGRNVLSTIAQGNDITERIKAELEAQKSREKLNIALENGNIGIWEWDIRTDTVEWDERMEKMFGLEPGSFEKTYDAFEKYIFDEDLPHMRYEFRLALEEDIPLNTIYRTRLKNDTISYISTKALVEKDNNGKPIKMSGVSLDITEMKKGTEKALFRLNENLLRSNKELEQFAYVASHDLQEPLRMVSSFTQLLSKRYKDKLDKDAQEFIQFAVDGANRMQVLINDLLEFSRIETRGKKFSVIDIHTVLGHAIKNLSLIIKEKNALVINDALPTVMADEGQMVQLFQNLIGNALKFCDTSPKIHISAKEETDHYLFKIKDNGIGIESQYFNKIFQIFQRLQPKEAYSGTGIGLAICKRIIERHGGKIWVESKPDKGSDFYFTIIK